MIINNIENIVLIVAYKNDLLTTDKICFNLRYEDGSEWTISEEDPDWECNLERLGNLYGFDREWRNKVVLPPFESCETVIYRKMLV